jgi:spermidine/putrescine transport system ATP-binding protein
MSDRIAVMHAGKMLQIGSPTEIYERPATRYVADFIGEANFLDGHVSANDGMYTIVTLASGVSLSGIAQHPMSAGAPVTIAIRPEKLRLTVQPTDQLLCLPATVERVLYIGSDTRLTVSLDNGAQLDVWEQNNRSTLDRDAYWQKGERGYVWWTPDNALIMAE